MRHSKFPTGDSNALSSRTVRNLLVDDDWNRLPWLRDESETLPAHARQSLLPWFVTLLVTVASLSYVQGREVAESAWSADASCTAEVAQSCMRVWESVTVGSRVQVRAPAASRTGRLSPAVAMTSGDRELLGEWLLLAQTLSPGQPNASPRPIAPY